MAHQLANEPDARSLIVEGLNPYTFYRCSYFYLKHLYTPASPAYSLITELYFRFRMRQVNIVGTSPPSQPSRKIQTLQAPPDIAPANVTLRTASETSLWLRWVVGEHHIWLHLMLLLYSLFIRYAVDTCYLLLFI